MAQLQMTEISSYPSNVFEKYVKAVRFVSASVFFLSGIFRSERVVAAARRRAVRKQNIEQVRIRRKTQMQKSFVFVEQH